MGLNYSVILCSAVVLCYVNCEPGDWQVHYDHSVDHGDTHKVHDSELIHKEHHGGSDKGKKDWDSNAYKKYVQEWGKFGDEDHSLKDKHGDKHYKKDSLDKHGDDWKLAQGGYEKSAMDEWKGKEKWAKDKGNGYVKKWNWEKENGERDAHGKKASHADHHHKKSQGHKHSLKKHQDDLADKYGYKDYNSGKKYKKHGNEHVDSGDSAHGFKTWQQKKPQYQKYQKILKSTSHKKNHGHQYE